MDLEHLASRIKKQLKKVETVYGTISYERTGYNPGSGYEISRKYKFLKEEANQTGNYDQRPSAEEIRKDALDNLEYKVRPFVVEDHKKYILITRPPKPKLIKQ